ncbi:hypothetical protein ACQPYK_29130 [Streptosporangium sp. CA-135522]|uniref:hypothetical protein n=1 Tax=Streptosporangium sp. CA-135522 TaxID=3240072 RepID=UPI003D8A9E86
MTDAPADGDQSYEDQVVAGPGGVMTDEVGVITGELTVRTEISGGQARVRVQYTGAEEWYALTGSPVPLAGRPARQLHQAIMEAVRAGLPAGLTTGQPPTRARLSIKALSRPGAAQSLAVVNIGRWRTSVHGGAARCPSTCP